MKASTVVYTATGIIYGVLLGILLLIAICEIIGGGSSATEFRYQGF